MTSEEINKRIVEQATGKKHIEKKPSANPADILLRVRIATHQIESARKQAVSVYDEDLRALKELDARLATIQSIAQPELFNSENVLTPELMQLIESPLAKY